MSRKKRFQVGQKQRQKRYKRRLKLKSQGHSPDEFFYGKYYIGGSDRQSQT